MENVCPVCGYDGLEEMPYDEEDCYPSWEICECCGFQYGFTDYDEGISFEEYRKQWVTEGANWRIRDLKPLSWDLGAQLKRIQGLDITIQENTHYKRKMPKR